MDPVLHLVLLIPGERCRLKDATLSPRLLVTSSPAGRERGTERRGGMDAGGGGDFLVLLLCQFTCRGSLSLYLKLSRPPPPLPKHISSDLGRSSSSLQCRALSLKSTTGSTSGLLHTGVWMSRVCVCVCPRRSAPL